MRRPTFIAQQARHARGPIGRIVAFIMARETWSQNQRAMAALDVRNRESVLDIGCGHGRSLGHLSQKTPDGLVVGVDPSELMAEIARRGIKDLIRAGQADVSVARVEHLPFTDVSFDKVLCVHVLYFWPELSPALSEISRVLRRGGRLALLFRTEVSLAVASFPPDVYRFRSLEEVAGALSAAGLEPETVNEVGDCVLISAKNRPA